MKVSVIVPVYQAEKYISDCVRSIRSQTYQDLEILLIDDGSTDRSLEICKEFQKMDGRIKVIHQDNRGVSAARNKGIAEANGDFIIFVDSDDCIEADMISFMVDKALRYKAEIVFCGFEYVYSDHVMKELPALEEGLYKKEVLYQYFWNLYDRRIVHNIGTKLYSADLLSQYGVKFLEERQVFEDIQFCLDALKYVEQFYVCKQVFYKYMVQKNQYSIQKTYRKEYCNHLAQLFDSICLIGIKKDSEFYSRYMEDVLLALRNELYRKKRNYHLIKQEYQKICNSQYVIEAGSKIGCKDVGQLKYIFYLLIWHKQVGILVMAVCLWHVISK